MEMDNKILRLKENTKKDDTTEKKWYQKAGILDWIFLVGMLTINPFLCYIMIVVLTPFNPSLLLTVVIIDIPLFLWFRYDRTVNGGEDDFFYSEEEWKEIKERLEELRQIEEARAAQKETGNSEARPTRRISFRRDRGVS